MADKSEVKKDEVVVDEQILEGSIIAPFVWIYIHIWGQVVDTLPVELRLEVERTCEIQDGCIVMPRIIWHLVKNITEVRSVQH